MAIKFILKEFNSEESVENDQILGEFAFSEAMFTIGSAEANNLVFDDIAPEQAVFINEGNHLKLINGAEGTFLNGRNLRREAMVALKHKDKIRVGKHIILVLDEELSIPKPIEPIEKKNKYDTTPSHTLRKKYPLAKKSVKEKKQHISQVKSSRDFAAVLNNLRTEEDSFYFIIKKGEKEIGRVPLENNEIPIGKNSKGIIVFDAEQISVLYGVARKDWSGILIESQRRNSILINDKHLETSQRLRNNDRLSFSSAPKGISLTLHEPSLLVALEPLMTDKHSSNGNLEKSDNKPAIKVKQKVPLIERRYFGYFSFLEVMTMIIGTLIGAVLFFLFFEIVFSL